jgi:3-hydroxy-3-methylglutaryl CoA synthase
MRIDAVRYGVRSNKTLRKVAGRSDALYKAQNEVLKKSYGSGPKIELVNGKLMKSANNYEKVDKNERKRKLKENEDQYYDAISEEEGYDEEDEIFYVHVVDDTNKVARKHQDSDEEEETSNSDLEESKM